MNRLHQLINKFLSVKGVFAISSSVIFASKPTEESMYVCLCAWGLFILGREVFKIISLLKGVDYEPPKDKNKKDEVVS